MADWVAKYQSNNSKQGGADQGIVRTGSDVLKSIGLGAIPDILGAGQFGAQKLLAGQNPFSAAGQTPQQLQQTTAGNLFINPQTTGGATQAGQDLAGAASWLVPEVKALKGGGLAASVINHSLQGALQGGLGAVSQGGNPVTGAEQGAVVNPVMTGAGNFLTDILPKYIGIRNFGYQAGKQLPDVVKAENAAASTGTSLEDIRSALANTAKFSKPNEADKLVNQIDNLASQGEWVGTPGIADKLKEIRSAVTDAKNPFEAYNMIKNKAYANENTPAGDRLTSFMHSAAQKAREYLINNSDNPTDTRKAMDLYAAQTAMGAGKKGNLISGILADVKRGGPSIDFGLAAAANVLPQLHGIAGLPLADFALTNPVTGPVVARGLVNAGQAVGNSGLDNILTRLGIAGVQNAANP